MRIIFIFITMCYLSNSCTSRGQKAAPITAPEETYTWTQITPNAAYSKTYNYQLFNRNGKLYIFQMDGAWVSDDGKNWTKTGLENIIQNNAFLDYVVFKDAIYALGTFSGKMSRPELSSQIARTTDLKTWEILAQKSNLPARFFYHPFVFQNKIWIIGGNNGQTIFKDAWTSADGIEWKQVADNLPFGERDDQHFVILNNRLYMISRDVWVSDDGLQWEMVTPSVADGSLQGYQALVFDGKIWLIGNYRDGKLASEVFYSSDGKNWKMQNAPWSPRGGVAASVFNNQVIITGGKYAGTTPMPSAFDYVNDVWVMRKEGGGVTK